jgi:hypothetical protein
MPKRQDINKILIIGSGPIVIGRPASLIIQEHKPVRRSDSWI